MEEIKKGEQPEVEEQALKGIVDENLDEGAEIQQQEGSQFGKFNSPEDLLKAYNNLQAEFTRKCQKLSEVQKQFVEKDEQDTSKKDETISLSPAFEQESWHSKVAAFLTENEKAKGFSLEISDEILQDSELQNNPNMLDIAWARVLAKNYKSPEQIISDDSFMENYILSNEQLKKRIMNSYINEVNNKKSPSVISSGMKGGASLLTRGNRPSTLGDAKILAEKIFKK